MILRTLIESLENPATSGALDQNIAGLSSDSRAVEANFIFAAVRGHEADGHQFIQKAIAAGAAAILAETAPPADLAPDLAWIHVPNSRQALAKLAATFYQSPSKQLKVAGITGTNGKTTTSYLLHYLMRHEWLRAGLIGTIKVDDGLEQRDATHTTPGPVELQAMLGDMRDNACRGVAMEVSSHALDQMRTAEVEFDVAVFTNFTQDHLDYHKTMEAYFEAKRRLFEQLRDQGKKGTAVINTDDPKGKELADWCAEQGIKTLTYGYNVHVDVRATQLRLGPRGTEFELTYKGSKFLVRTPLIGRFNVSNTLAALASAVALRIPLRESVRSLNELPQVPGRLQLADSRRGKHVFIDYAHTPDALEKVCAALTELEPNRLITVFGCGGDRDQSKRPLMAQAAEANSDFCIITSDNPRSEDPDAIIAEIAAGMKGRSFARVADRSEALVAALRFARPGDIVLVAGKGHEPYQEIAGVKHPFNDHSKIRGIMARLETEFAEQLKERDAAKKQARQERFGDLVDEAKSELKAMDKAQDAPGDSEDSGEKKKFHFRDEEDADA